MECGLEWFFCCEPERIILEDDVVPNADFIKFTLEMLETHRHNHSIWMVSGHPQGLCRPQRAPTYLTKYSHIWGWATWASRWTLHQKNLTWWSDYKSSKQYRKLHPLKLERQYWNHYMDLVLTGAIDTWDLQFQASMWRNGGLSLSSSNRTVDNVGFRSDATHTKVKPSIFVRPLEGFIGDGKTPPKRSCVGDVVEFLEIAKVWPWWNLTKKIGRLAASSALR